MPKYATCQAINSMAAKLSDPEAHKQSCEDAGRVLLDVIRNQPFDRVQAAAYALSCGLPLFRGLGRRPPRPADIILTDHAMKKRVELYRALGERLMLEADHSKNRQERKDVEDALDAFDLKRASAEAATKIAQTGLDEILEMIGSVTAPDAINRTEDDLMDAQDVKLDALMYVMAGALVAAAERLKDFVEYGPSEP